MSVCMSFFRRIVISITIYILVILVKLLEGTMHKEVYQVITADDGPPARRLAS